MSQLSGTATERPLVGGLGNQWAFLCGEAKAGASDPVVLQVGLLSQETLDGKLVPDLDMDKMWKSVCSLITKLNWNAISIPTISVLCYAIATGT